MIGDVIETLMRARGLTQGRLAEAIDATQATVSRYISSARTPDSAETAKLAEVLGVTPRFLNNSWTSPSRRRLTLAHELGHLVMHSDGYGDDDMVDVEAQANAFAAEFLMPEAEIRHQLKSLKIPNLLAQFRSAGLSDDEFADVAGYKRGAIPDVFLPQPRRHLSSV